MRTSPALRHLLLAPLAFALAGCTLDAGKVEKSIRDKLEGEGLEIASVECPKSEPIKKDGTFTCKGKEKDGEKFTVDVTQKGQGNIEWEMQEKYADMDKIERSLEKKTGKKVSLDCGRQAFIITKGREVDCTVKAGGDKSKIKVTFHDAEGDDVTIDPR